MQLNSVHVAWCDITPGFGDQGPGLPGFDGDARQGQWELVGRECQTQENLFFSSLLCLYSNDHATSFIFNLPETS
jgi:hypothetical protein